MRRPWAKTVDDVRLYDDSILRTPVRDVTHFGEHLRELVQRLLRVQKRDRALGVAAPQIGESWNVFVLNGSLIERGGKPEVYVNARILSEEGDALDEEGCLSFPGIFVPVLRPSQVGITAHDVEGHPIEREGKGLLARAFSHEIDHLQGRLMIDRVPPDKRERIIERMQSKARKVAR